MGLGNQLLVETGTPTLKNFQNLPGYTAELYLLQGNLARQRQMNGKIVPGMVLDTASNRTILKESFCKEIGIPFQGVSSVAAVGGSGSLGKAKLKTLTIGSLLFKNLEISTSETIKLDMTRTGIFGTDILSQFNIGVNFKHNEIILSRIRR